MAERPVFVPAPSSPFFVMEKNLSITWSGGFAESQKKKNIRALHDAAKVAGIGEVLEASTKSDDLLGKRLSAFNLKVKTGDLEIPLECVYQGSKVFERGGPYTDLYFVEPKAAKRDVRLLESGALIGFQFKEFSFPLEPKTVFYDWLYLSAIFPHRDWLDRLSNYAGFTDIEFNPKKSINCQARSLALFVALKANRLLEGALQSPDAFIEVMKRGARSRAPLDENAGMSLDGTVANGVVQSPGETVLGAPVELNSGFTEFLLGNALQKPSRPGAVRRRRKAKGQ